MASPIPGDESNQPHNPTVQQAPSQGIVSNTPALPYETINQIIEHAFTDMTEDAYDIRDVEDLALVSKATYEHILRLVSTEIQRNHETMHEMQKTYWTHCRERHEESPSNCCYAEYPVTADFKLDVICYDDFNTEGCEQYPVRGLLIGQEIISRLIELGRGMERAGTCRLKLE